MRLLAFLLPIALHAQTILLSAGGNALQGYQPDTPFLTGSSAIWGPDTPDYQPLGSGVWESLRYGISFGYDIPLANGLYRVNFLLIEPNKTAVGQRRFSIAANGVQTPPLDLFALAPGQKVQHQRELLLLVGDGRLRIQFTGIAGQNALVTAVEIRPWIPPIAILTDFRACIGEPKCAGLFYAKVRKADGTEAGPFYLFPVTPESNFDPNAWKPEE